MSNLRALLERTDPSREDLSSDELALMRQRIVSASAKSRPARGVSRASVVLVVLLCAVVVEGVRDGLFMRRQSENTDQPIASRSTEGLRTLQFVTPGGTRVFWTFHPRSGSR